MIPNGRAFAYIAVMGLVTYAIRALPLTLIRREIKDRRVKAFLHYVPFVTLSVMTFPDILGATDSTMSGAAAFIVALVTAFLGRSIFTVSIAASLAVLAVEFFI